MFLAGLGAWNWSQVGHVGTFFRHLGSQLGVLGPTWIQVGRLRAILAPSLGVLEAILVPSWVQNRDLEAQEGARTLTDLQAEACRELVPSWAQVGTKLGPSWTKLGQVEPSWAQNGRSWTELGPS